MNSAIEAVNPITEYLVAHIVGVYFVYGLAFFTLGVVMALASRQHSTLPLVRALPLLAWFGLLHGLNEWVVMFDRIAVQNGSSAPSVVGEVLRVALLVVSFLCLLGFGVEALRPGSLSPTRRRLLFFLPFAIWAVALAAALLFWRPSPREGIAFADVLSRYFIAIPGALLVAFALMAQQRMLRERDMPVFGRDLVSAAAVLILYGAVGQVFVPPTEIPPSNIVNGPLFLEWFGIPVQLFRAVTAALILFFMVRALRVLEEETRRRVESSARAEVEVQQQALAAEQRAGREREALNQELAARPRDLALLLELSNLLGVAVEMPRRLALVLPRVVQSLVFTNAGLILCIDSHSDVVDVEAQTGFVDSSAAAPPTKLEHDERAPVATFSNCLSLGKRSIASRRAACRHVDGAVIDFNIGAVLLGEECWMYASPTVALALPLMANHTPIGSVVFAQTETVERTLELDELHLMVGIARQLELSMENARLYRQAQEREETLGHLLTQVVAAQETERQRIARELHDATGQSLTAIAMGLRGLANSISSDADVNPPSGLQRQAESIQHFATDALGELRRIIADLRPPQLDELGLVPALRWYVQSFRKRHPEIDLTLMVAGDHTRLPPHYDTVVFRVVQEALTNIAKHSGASRAGVVLEMKPGEVVVTVQDNGKGFDPTAALNRRGQSSAWGLLGIRERTVLLNGRYEIKSAPDQGTLIRISVPTASFAMPAQELAVPFDDGA